MRVLIRRWIVQGTERSAIDRVVDAPALTVGRGTDQNIELADLRIELAHAQIVAVGRNIHVIAEPGATLRLNGEPTDDHKLRAGDIVEIGRYRLQIGAAPDGSDFQIDVDEVLSSLTEAEQRTGRLRTSLNDLGVSRRTLAWALLFLVLVPALLFPAWLRFGLKAPPPSGPTAIISDLAWSPGPLSTVHASLGNDCSKCHTQAFAPVSNSACLACHQNTRHHIDDVHLAALPALATSRCEDCHREHRGSASLIDTRNTLCLSCHAQPERSVPGAKLVPVSGFSPQQSHPQFTALVSRFHVDTGQFSWIEVSEQQPQELHADNNLRFPHDRHLAAAGLLTPEGTKHLVCADCHEADDSGVSFKPVQMDRHCAACHRLDFDPDDPQRTVPHAQPAQVVGVLRDYYAHAALSGGVQKAGAPASVQLLRTPGQPLQPEKARQAMAWADRESAIVIDEVFDKRLCSTCHVVRHTGNPALPFDVAPVAPQRTGQLPHARFSHAAHRGETCASCHNAVASKSSEDVLLPGLKRCRDCHGDVGSGAKVQSTCLTCHGFHVADRTMASALGGATAARPTDTAR